MSISNLDALLPSWCDSSSSSSSSSALRLPLPALTRFAWSTGSLTGDEAASHREALFRFLDVYGPQLRVLDLTLDSAQPSTSWMDVCKRCTALRRLRLAHQPPDEETLTARSRSSPPPLLSIGWTSLHTLEVVRAVRYEEELAILVDACPVLTCLKVDSASHAEPLNLTMGVLLHIGRTCRLLHSLQFNHLTETFITAESGEARAAAATAPSSSSASTTPSSLFPNLQSLSIRFSSWKVRDYRVPLLSALVSILENAPLRELDLDIVGPLSDLQVFAPLTSLRRLATWIDLPARFATTDVDHLPLVGSAYVQFDRFDPNRFLAEKLVGRSSSGAGKHTVFIHERRFRLAGDLSRMDGREAFFADLRDEHVVEEWTSS